MNPRFCYLSHVCLPRSQRYRVQQSRLQASAANGGEVDGGIKTYFLKRQGKGNDILFQE